MDEADPQSRLRIKSARATGVAVPGFAAPAPEPEHRPTDPTPGPGRDTSPISRPRAQPAAGTFASTAVLKAAMVATDVATIAGSFVIASLLVARWAGWSADQVREHLVVAAWTLPVWPVLFARQHLYASRFLTRLFDELRRAIKVVVVGVVAIIVVGWLLGDPVSRSWLATFLVVAVGAVICERFVVRRCFVHRRRAGRSLRDVLIVGTNAEARALARSFADPSLGYRAVGFVALENSARGTLDGLPVLSCGEAPESTVEAAHRIGAQGVIIATTGVGVGIPNRMLRELLGSGLHVEMTSGLSDVTPERMTVRPLGRHPVIYIEPVRRRGWRTAAKRTFDIVLSALGLVLAAPVLVVSAVAIKATSRGPVLFRQDRVGRDGELFELLKLRTMVPGAEDMLDDLLAHNEADGPLFKISQDPRITPVGRWLRRLSIDELPQLWNVLRGDMSLVGPRPALPREVAHWDDELFERLRVRPGITGMWQVSGRSDTGFEAYQRLDLFYVDNWSMLIDLGILLRTVPTVVSGRGAR